MSARPAPGAGSSREPQSIPAAPTAPGARRSEARSENWATEGEGRRKKGRGSFHSNIFQLRLRFPSIHSSIFTSTNLLVASLWLIVWDLKFTESWLRHPARKRNCKFNVSHPKTLNPPTPLQEIRDIFLHWDLSMSALLTPWARSFFTWWGWGGAEGGVLSILGPSVPTICQ